MASTPSDGAARIRASHVAAALGTWTYRTTPRLEDAVYDRLSRSFPDVEVRFGEQKMEADILVDDVGVRIVRGLHDGTSREFRILTDQYDELVLYSPSVHRTYPDQWERVKHLYGSERNPGSNVHFVEKKPPAPTVIEEPSGVEILLLIPLVMFGIAGLLAAFVGVFTGFDMHMTTAELFFVGAFSALVFVIAIGVFVLTGAYRPYCNSLIIRLKQ